MLERTLSIIKPDATKRNLIGSVLTMINEAGLNIVAMKMINLSKEQAEGFYAVHKEKPFFNDLVKFMTSGSVVVSVLEAENAIAEYRKIMGATNPEKADEGTIRKRYAESVERNSVHGSDAPETATFEIRYFFNCVELI